MATAQPVPVGSVVCGPGHPLVWIAGPCVIESHDLTLRIADTLRPFPHARIYGAWDGRQVTIGGPDAVQRSAERYLRFLDG